MLKYFHICFSIIFLYSVACENNLQTSYISSLNVLIRISKNKTVLHNFDTSTTPGIIWHLVHIQISLSFYTNTHIHTHIYVYTHNTQTHTCVFFLSSPGLLNVLGRKNFLYSSRSFWMIIKLTWNRLMGENRILIS